MNYKKDILFNTVGNFAYLGALWLMSILVVRLGNFELAGYFSLALTMSNIFISLASYTVRLFYAADIQRKYQDHQYFYMRVFTTALSFILCIAGTVVFGYSSYSLAIIVLFYIYKIFEMLSDILFGALQRCGKLYLSGYSMTLKAVVSLIVFSGMLLISDSLICTIIAIDVVAAAIFFFVDIPIARRQKIDFASFSKEDLRPIKLLLRICFPLFLVGLCYNTIPSIPRLTFERLYSAEQFGIYSSLSTVTVLISTAVTCVTTPLIPKLAELYQKKETKSLAATTLYLLGIVFAVGLAALVLAHFLGEQVLAWIFGDEVRSYMSVFKWIIVATVLTSVIICLNDFFTAVERQKDILGGCITGVVLCAGISIPLCKAFYMNGVAYSLVISQGIEIAILVLCAGKILKRLSKDRRC